MMEGWALILSGLTLGILGSFHCIGMCGPLALALPLPEGSWFTRLVGMLLYNAGRVITYALLGALFGFVGRQFYIGGWQQGLSIVSGFIIIMMVIFRSRQWGNFRIGKQVRSGLSYLFQREQFSSLFFIGILNGLLPCGMVHLAIMSSLSLSKYVYDGVLFMTGFGVATLPAMLSFTFFGNRLTLSARNFMHRFIPYMAVCMGILLILRGFGLGIPFISPAIPPYPGAAILCHP